MITRARKFLQTFTADTIALLVYGTLVSASSLLFEVFVFKIAIGQFGIIRVFYNLTKYASARIPAKLTDFLIKRIPIASKNRFYEAIVDWIALSIHQIPIYIVWASVFGVSSQKIIIISLIYLFENLIFGWLYGILLKWAEEKFINKTT